MDFFKTLLNSDNAMMLGVSLFAIGIFYYFAPRLMGEHFKACHNARQILKQEAQQLGQTKRFDRLISEEKSISKIPCYSKILMAVGLGSIIAAVVWRYI